MEFIDNMNNRVSTGYITEEDHFQYSTVVTLPSYEETLLELEVMHRALSSPLVVHFENISNLPITRTCFMEEVRKVVYVK
jgi:hypothetical protein